MATLTGELISETYDALLKVSDNQTITGVKKRITDGFGNETPLLISSTDIEIDGNLILSDLVNASTDTDKFLVLDTTTVKYRTGSQLLSDIGGQGSITLTTTGTSGASTLIGNTLNIPNYSGGGITSLSTIGTSPNAFGATISGTQLNLEPASASFGGVVTTLAQTFAGNKTLTGALIGTTGSFTSSGGSDTFSINHSSGSGIALNITKGGNGEGIYVNKTSGTGNAVTIIGTLNATTLVKSGGTSSEFLMADGSVNTSVSPTGAYLPLTGGTLTGALSGTSATFTGTGTFGTLNSATIPLVAYASTSNIGLKLIGTSTGNGNGTYFYANNGSTLLGSVNIAGTAMAISNEQTGILYFATSGSEQARISSSGDFSIGTSSGGFKLNVNGTGNFSGALSGTSATFSSTLTGTDIQLRGTINPFTSNISTITLGGTNATHSGNIDFQVNGVSKSFIVHRQGNLTSYLTGTEGFAIENPGGIRLLVNSSGNVLIGTTSDAGYKLDVNGTFRVSGAATFSGDILINNSSNAQIGFDTTGALNSTGAYQYFNRSSVNKWAAGMGPADGSDNYQIVTAGVKALQLTVTTGAATFSSLAGAGSRAVNADASGTLSAASDSRLKQEVLDYKVEGLAEILKMQPRAYKWLSDIENRGENAATEIGFFANEVASIIPSAAPMGNDGYYGFYDRAVIAALVNSVKELNARIIQLEN
jgi:hypothetical protein